MNPISSPQPEKKPVQNRKYTIQQHKITFKINRKFVIIPAEKRAEYVKLLDKMIHRVERIINGQRTKTRQRLRAMTVLSDLIKTSYSMVHEEEVEQLEWEIAALEKEKSKTAKTEEAAE